MGLDPAEIGPPIVERHVPEPTPELEPAPGRLEPFLPELEPEVSTAELDAGRERLAAAVRSRSRAPFDAEDTTVERFEEDVETAASAGTGRPNAPFDIERETAVPRAA
jgi:hypothetical protein